MRTAMDVKQALDLDLFVTLVQKKQEERAYSDVLIKEKDPELFVNMLPAMKRESKFVRKSNVIPFPSVAKNAGEKKCRCKRKEIGAL